MLLMLSECLRLRIYYVLPRLQRITIDEKKEIMVNSPSDTCILQPATVTGTSGRIRQLRLSPL